MSPASNRLRAYLPLQAVQPSGSIAVLAIIQIDGLIRCTPIFCGRSRDAECYDIISDPVVIA